jgi:predicted ATPase
LITDSGGSSVALTALKGMGGIGKTVLAQTVCHDQVIQQAFPDGVIWVTAGREPWTRGPALFEDQHKD